MNGQLRSPPPRYDRGVAPAVAWPTELDARGSAPNQVKAVLAALGAIPTGHPQFLRTNVEPTQLLRALAVQGVSADIGELPDETCRTVVRRQTATPSF